MRRVGIVDISCRSKGYAISLSRLIPKSTMSAIDLSDIRRTTMPLLTVRAVEAYRPKVTTTRLLSIAACSYASPPTASARPRATRSRARTLSANIACPRSTATPLGSSSSLPPARKPAASVPWVARDVCEHRRGARVFGSVKADDESRRRGGRDARTLRGQERGAAKGRVAGRG